MTDQSTPFSDLFEAQNAHFHSNVKQSTVRQRIKKLKAIRTWIRTHKEEIKQALHDDFKKPPVEAELIDIKPVITELNHAIAHLKDWMGTKRVKTPLVLFGGKSRIVAEPKGVALILSPWNFPFLLTVGPIVSAVAAGCCMIVKPSEYTPNTSKVIQRLVTELFDENEVSIQLGDASVAQQLLELPFNHIFFTGSTAVGKIVMRAAAEHMASVTLELGGCNPCILESDINLKKVARRVLWGKLMNSGQSCLSVNTLYVADAVYDKFLPVLENEFRQMYGDPETIESNNDLAHIVNASNFARVSRNVQESVEAGASVFLGGNPNEAELFFPPTILTRVTAKMPVVTEENFGPVLPIIRFTDREKLLSSLRKAPKPLITYVFTGSAKNRKFWLNKMGAGMLSANETHIFFNNMELPFGGDNLSGLGKSHGHAGFLAFTNDKTYFRQPAWYTPIRLIHPPYTGFKVKLARLITRWL
jgi:aldehyde dehydrogenase (NAD+)